MKLSLCRISAQTRRVLLSPRNAAFDPNPPAGLTHNLLRVAQSASALAGVTRRVVEVLAERTATRPASTPNHSTKPGTNDRTSVASGKVVSDRVDPGVRRTPT